MTVDVVKYNDIGAWMALVAKIKGGFPGLESEEALAEHRATVSEFIKNEAALCVKLDGKMVGALLFSRDSNMLCFLAVDEEYRRLHIARSLVESMLKILDNGKAVTVTTYREGVPEGAAARTFYKSVGFVEGKLTEEFGSPVQEFVLER